MERTWHLITGEYPPQPGGVSDYTRQLAEGLFHHGHEVHVWSRRYDDETVASNGVKVHRAAGNWSARDLIRLHGELNDCGKNRTLLIQYAPNAWGFKGTNMRFCNWVFERRQMGDDVRLMVHEPFYPWRMWDKPTRWVLAAIQRRMMRTLLSASSQVYLSIPGWEPMLRPYESKKHVAMTWLPTFTTIPVLDDAPSVIALRKRLAFADQKVIGSFGTFGGAIGEMVSEVFIALLRGHPKRLGLLLGRGGDSFARRLRAAHPEISEQLLAPGAMEPEAVSRHLQACDVLVQPYSDGVSSRRTSTMAGLAHGLPIVTTHGFLSEPLWVETGCVALVAAHDSQAMIVATTSLLADPESCSRLRVTARATYEGHFALQRTIETISLG